MTELEFRKMHGLGNDFIIIDQRAGGDMNAAQARALCDRRRGVGCDQLIILRPDPECAARMDIWNPDGSRAQACGNATRCVADILMREQGVDALSIRTARGALQCARLDEWIEVDMGAPRLDWADIPLARAMETDFIDPALMGLDAARWAAFGAVNMGNPHCVFFVEDMAALELARIGPQLETHPLLPERANIEFCRIDAPDEIRMRVWERGAGITSACGSGACAALVAAYRQGRAARRCSVALDGGALEIEWRENDDHILMRGPASYVYRGRMEAGWMRQFGEKTDA